MPTAEVPSAAPAPSTMVVVLGGPIAPAAAGPLGDRLEALLRTSAPSELVCDVGAVLEPDLAVVDALSRVRLVARRRGLPLRVVGTGPALAELLALCGLAGVYDLAEPGDHPSG